MPEMQAITCPRCGGVPDPEGGPGYLARCTSCGVLGRIEDPSGGQRLAVFPTCDAGTLLPHLARALREKGFLDSHLHTQELLFVPFWRFEAQLAGQVQGEREVREWKIHKETTEEGSFSYIRVEERFKDKERVRREIQKTLLAHVSACPLDEMGLPTLDSKRQSVEGLGLRRPFRRMGNVAPFHPGLHATGIVLDPLVPLSKAEEEVQVFLDHVEKSLAADLLPGATIDAAVIGREATLVYYPVMSLRFSCSGGQGAALFDANTADLIALSVPGRPPLTPERRLVGLCGLAAGVIAGSLMRLALLPPPWMSSPAGGPWQVRLLVLGLAIAGAAWWVLRHIVHTVDGETPS